MRVTWSDRAIRSLAEIHDHLVAHSDADALREVDRILKRGAQLGAFPRLGRVVAHYQRPDVRELIEPPYRIVYRIRRTDIQIVDVFHGSQRPPWLR